MDGWIFVSWEPNTLWILLVVPKVKPLWRGRYCAAAETIVGESISKRFRLGGSRHGMDIGDSDSCAGGGWIYRLE